MAKQGFLNNAAFLNSAGATDNDDIMTLSEVEALPGAVFGSEYQTPATSSGESSTTSASPGLTKVTLTTSSLPAGTYRIEGQFLYSSDDENEVMIFVCEEDNGGTPGAGTTRWSAYPVQKKKYSDGVYNSTVFFFYTTLTAGVHRFDLNYANSDSKTTYIKEALLTGWRVS